MNFNLSVKIKFFHIIYPPPGTQGTNNVLMRNAGQATKNRGKAFPHATRLNEQAISLSAALELSGIASAD